MATSPTLLQQAKDTGGAIMDAIRARYASGPSGAPLTPGPGSVLDQHNMQIQQLAPMPLVQPAASAQPPTSAQDLVHSQGQYGSQPGESRMDVSEWVKPLSGLAGIARKGGK